MSERKIAYYVKIKRQWMSLQAKGNGIGVTAILSNLFNTNVYYELPECSRLIFSSYFTIQQEFNGFWDYWRLRVQSCPSPINPDLHVHTYDPHVL